MQPTVSFSAFTAQLTVSSYQPSFTLLCNFTLGSGSNGIDPAAEEVTLVLGTIIAAIPPGSFQMTKPGDWAFTGVVDGISMKATINHKSGKTYTFQAVANVNLLGKPKPAMVTLTIGNDTGTTTVRF